MASCSHPFHLSNVYNLVQYAKDKTNEILSCTILPLELLFHYVLKLFYVNKGIVFSDGTLAFLTWLDKDIHHDPKTL